MYNVESEKSLGFFRTRTTIDAYNSKPKSIGDSNPLAVIEEESFKGHDSPAIGGNQSDLRGLEAKLNKNNSYQSRFEPNQNSHQFNDKNNVEMSKGGHITGLGYGIMSSMAEDHKVRNIGFGYLAPKNITDEEEIDNMDYLEKYQGLSGVL
jgi:hypothetical protein